MSIVGNLSPVLFLTFTINESSKAAQIAADMGLMPDRLGMKCGILVGMLFSLVAVFVYLRIMKTQKNFIAERRRVYPRRFFLRRTNKNFHLLFTSPLAWQK